MAELERQRRDRDGVLEQAAEIRVVRRAGAPGGGRAAAAAGPRVRTERRRRRAGRATDLRAQRRVAEQTCEQPLQARFVDLAREVFEEPFELVEVAVGSRQEAGGVGVSRRFLGARDRLQRDLELVAEALDASLHAHQLAPLEAPGEHVGVAERARANRAGAVAQLDREVGRARSGDLALLAHAREHAVDLLLEAQGRDLNALGLARDVVSRDLSVVSCASCFRRGSFRP